MIDRLAGLLSEKHEKFMEYETVTKEMLAADADSAEKYITKRDEIANRIDAISDEMRAVCDGLPEGKVLLDTMWVRLVYDDVPREYRGLYKQGQGVHSVAARIQNLDRQALERFESFKLDALGKIRENKTLPQIKKYMTDLGSEQQTGTFKQDKV